MNNCYVGGVFSEGKESGELGINYSQFSILNF